MRNPKTAHRYTLEGLREALGKTQQDVALAMGVEVGYVARVERHLEDVHVSSVATYLRALGGTLELAAVIDGRRHVIMSEEKGESQ